MQEIKGGVTVPRGFKAAGIKCGLKKNKKDLALLHSEVPARAVALFTTNRIQAPPLKVTREHLRDGRAQTVIINSGNANACTGKEGLDNARLMAELTARHLKIREKDVLVASTGIIGRPLPMDKIKRGIKGLAKKLQAGGGLAAAEAIMTTDTFPKEKAVKITVRGKGIFIGGIAKGSGMIFPHLATMLSFITTDACISQRALRKALKDSVDKSFNTITVDGDTSTNDMVVILANGQAGNEEIKEDDKTFPVFRKALGHLTLSLAGMIVTDGEGATKFVEIKVKNARSPQEAKKAACSIANSNLVKTAIFGGDANWGRIMATLGRAGIKLTETNIDIHFSSLPPPGELKKTGRKSLGMSVTIVKNGRAAKCNRAKTGKIMSGKNIRIAVDLKSGRDEATIWTTDLSEDYVRINSRYPA